MLEVTRNRLEALAAFDGTIELGEDPDNGEIIIRLKFPTSPAAAENVYNRLLDIEDARCDICGRYCQEGLTDGLCEECADLPISAIEEEKLHELILKKTLGL